MKQIARFTGSNCNVYNPLMSSELFITCKVTTLLYIKCMTFLNM